MHILTITNLFPNTYDKRNGVFLYRQLRGLQKEGAKIEVWLALPLCPWPLYLFKKWREWGPATRPLELPGCEVKIVRYLRLPGAWFNRWSGLFLYMSCKRSLATRAKEFDRLYGYDIFPSGDAAVRLGRLFNLTTVCSAIGVDLMQTSERNERMRLHASWILRTADGVITCGRALADAVDRYAHRESLNVYGVVDLQRFRPLSDRKSVREELHLPMHSPIGVFSGYLQTRKGVYELLLALENLVKKRRDFLLIFCGEGPERSELEKRVKEKNLERNVLFSGFIPPENMANWYQAADLFVLPSHVEGMPNALMEAMACGLPAVASAVGGIPDAVGKSSGVLLIPPQAPEALSSAMEKLLSEPDYRQQMARQARTVAERDFGLQRNSVRIMEYFSQTPAETNTPVDKVASVPRR
ncbi:MAG: glycosyltransferase [Bdellovibrionales bacterium]|nr:glycosyltransferase [Bdellovibrionales bacterium]